MPKLTDKDKTKIEKIAAKDTEKADDTLVGYAFQNPTDKKAVKAGLKEAKRTVASLEAIDAILNPSKEPKTE